MKLMVIPDGRSLVFELQLSQTLRPILKRFAERLARYANIGILKTSSAEEENILGNVALSPPAEHSWARSATPGNAGGYRPNSDVLCPTEEMLAVAENMHARSVGRAIRIAKGNQTQKALRPPCPIIRFRSANVQRGSRAPDSACNFSKTFAERFRKILVYRLNRVAGTAGCQTQKNYGRGQPSCL